MNMRLKNMLLDWILKQSIFHQFPLMVVGIVMQFIGIILLLTASTTLGVALAGVGFGLHLAVAWINHDWQEMAVDVGIASFIAVLLTIAPHRQIF